MISDRSCDTEDWSNACWKFRNTEINDILTYIHTENSSNICNNSQYYCFCIFDHINTALVSKRNLFQKLLNLFQTFDFINIYVYSNLYKLIFRGFSLSLVLYFCIIVDH